MLWRLLLQLTAPRLTGDVIEKFHYAFRNESGAASRILGHRSYRLGALRHINQDADAPRPVSPLSSEWLLASADGHDIFG